MKGCRMGSGTSYRQQPEQKLKKEIPMTAPKKKTTMPMVNLDDFNERYG
jgi:hypothetical protein